MMVSVALGKQKADLKEVPTLLRLRLALQASPQLYEPVSHQST